MSSSMLSVFAQVRNLLQATTDNMLDLMSSERCRTCGSPVCVHEDDRLNQLSSTSLPAPRTLCHPCFESLLKSKQSFEYIPGPKALLPLAVAAPYDGMVRELIHKLKYERDRRIATDLAALVRRTLVKIYLSCPPPDTILVSIPLSRKRQLSRGYNQVDLIAAELYRSTGIGWSSRALKRTRETRAQHDLTRDERMENLKDAFTADPQIVLGRHIILLDDVVTSGATITQAQEALLSAGATGVIAVAVSRAELDGLLISTRN